jgi:cell division protein FtsZ
MKETGDALMGVGIGTGENKAIEATQMAVNSPLLEETGIDGAKAVLINIAGGNDLSLHEVNEVNDVIIRQVDPEANIIFGTTIDAALDDRVRVTVIATGFDRKRNMLAKGHGKEISDETGTSLQLIEGKVDKVNRKISGSNQTFRLDYDKQKLKDLSQEDLEIPAFLRRTLD